MYSQIFVGQLVGPTSPKGSLNVAASRMPQEVKENNILGSIQGMYDGCTIAKQKNNILQ